MGEPPPGNKNSYLFVAFSIGAKRAELQVLRMLQRFTMEDATRSEGQWESVLFAGPNLAHPGMVPWVYVYTDWPRMCSRCLP